MKRSRRKKQSKWNKNIVFRINSVIKTAVLRIVVLSVILSLNWTGLSAVIETFSYFNDAENSANIFSAALLDFSVTNRHKESFIGMEALSDIKFASVVTKRTGSLNIQYEVNAEMIGGNDDFCNALKMEVEHNGVEKHNGLLLSFSAATTTELGTWEFELKLPVSATNVPHGAECNVDLVFRGWRKDVVSFEESGFTDEERIELRLTSRMVVLNEFLPNPEGLAYGIDFGDDNSTMPQGEWVELYNNSDVSYNLVGWYIWDDSGDSENKIEITAANTVPSTTVIEGHSWLVVYMNKEVFNNDGDTVKLFDQNDKLVDSHTYTDNDYCEMEPTPGEENTTETEDGNCSGVPPNKSYARIPDGVGAWVDPVPTPGGPNVLEEDMVLIMEEEKLDEEDDFIDEEKIVIEEAAEEETLDTEIEETDIIIIDGLFISALNIPIQNEESILDEENISLQEEIPAEDTNTITDGVQNENNFNFETETTIENQPIIIEEELPNLSDDNCEETTASSVSSDSESGADTVVISTEVGVASEDISE